MKPAAYKWNLAALKAIHPQPQSHGQYSNFDSINGNHPWKFAVPNGFIEYQTRILRKSKVVYFNFALAKEMGLISQDHTHKLTRELEQKIIETFALRIINEYDQLTGAKFPKKDIKQNRYMATRYLQLQHSCKKGATSGDGRSMWNGHFTSETGIDWDISSCGTGATSLSPGAVALGRPIKTGDRNVSYGSGLADIDEGLTAAILSESFHHRGIHTERTLVIIEGPEKRGINVRAAKNLLRPSHLFLHLKQGNQLMLKSALELFIKKQIFNGEWPAGTRELDKYDVFMRKLSKRYGEFCAHLEDEYIFCWLDWDGDNMLLDGGIIDYGSIRQFGLCHHNYRYDDVDRYSTNIKEQKNKAKYLVQIFCQLIDFVQTGQKKHLAKFSESVYLRRFEKAFQRKRNDLLLKRIGISHDLRSKLAVAPTEAFQNFEKCFRIIEKWESAKGERTVPDGVNTAAIFNSKVLLRELPKIWLTKQKPLSNLELIDLIKTEHATKKELNALAKNKVFQNIQKTYFEFIDNTFKAKGTKRGFLECAMRSSQTNRLDYVTGDGIILVVAHLLDKRKKLGKAEFIKVVDAFIAHQQAKPIPTKLKRRSRKVLENLFDIVDENKHSI